MYFTPDAFGRDSLCEVVPKSLPNGPIVCFPLRSRLNWNPLSLLALPMPLNVVYSSVIKIIIYAQACVHPDLIFVTLDAYIYQSTNFLRIIL